MEVIEEIVRELEQCREDERNSRSEILQVIMAVCTALTIVSGASSIWGCLSNDDNNRLLFCFIVFVLCMAGAYTTSIGIVNVLRYHYMRQLEDDIEKQRVNSLKPDELKKETQYSMVHWMSFSGTIETKNFKHVKSIYTKITYGSYVIAIVFAMTLCVLITGYQYRSIENHNLFDNFLIVFLIVFFTALCFIFVFFTVKAADMYQWAYNEARRRRKERVDLNSAHTQSSANVTDETNRSCLEKNIKDVLLYFIYPKKKDIQKAFLIVLGFISGLIFSGNAWTGQQILDVLKILFIVDFLLYQARYQLNDIRGFKEDIELGKRDRLPVIALGEKTAIIISIVVIFLRIILASILIYSSDELMRNGLLISAVLILLCTIAYEYVRAKQYKRLTVLVVGLGYPLRFFSGMIAAWPEMLGRVIGNHQIFNFVILLLSYTCFGIYVAIIPWVHEAIYQKQEGKTIQKPHICWLLGKIEKRNGGNLCGALWKKCKISDPWNTAFLISLSLCSFAVCLKYILGIIWFFEFVFIIIAVIIAIKPYCKKSLIMVLFEVILKILVAFSVIKNASTYMYISFTQIFFVIVFYFLRFHFNSNFDCSQLIMTCIKKPTAFLLSKIVGDDALRAISGDKPSKKE